ncbi:MAG: hypothetical protein K9K37_04095 [Desulfocapsa sp.]|nr:hypothetical protein [Desulfocapsa sp.]
MIPRTLTGILLPDAWTGDGKISGFALCTDDEQKYVLKCCSGTDFLMAMLRQNIKVNGIVVEEAGERSINVITLQSLTLKEEL